MDKNKSQFAASGCESDGGWEEQYSRHHQELCNVLLNGKYRQKHQHKATACTTDRQSEAGDTN